VRTVARPMPLLPPVTTAVLPDSCSSMTPSLVGFADRIDGLELTSQQAGRFGQRPEIRSAQRAQPPFYLRALDGVGAEADRPLVGARGARGVAGAAEQLGVRGVQRLVALLDELAWWASALRSARRHSPLAAVA
jgi:hypothetical protein